MSALLSAEGISKSFGATQVLSGISLSVAPGEPVGLFGPNGSGKTTLVNILSGLLPPDAGTVRFDGKEITRLPLDARYRLGIARTFQIPHPYPGLSVREAMRVALTVNANDETLAGIVAALKPGTSQNLALHRDLKQIGDLLTVLRDRRVPVLWRPLHEFSGDWFWWGKHGPDAFKALWALMYDEFTHRRGLGNLIWVLGWAGQNVDPAWYPGRQRVDVAGADIYAEDHGALAPMFGKVKAIVGDSVPICLHENGPIPDPVLLGPQADWLWFMTWHTRWLTDPTQNDASRLKAYYGSRRYLTKDELPKPFGGDQG